MLKGDDGFFFFINLIIAFCNCAFRLELFLRVAMWPMGLLLFFAMLLSKVNGTL